MVNSLKNASCCFIGHRFIEKNNIAGQVKNVIIDLIENKNVKTFYFGTKSEFNDLCYDVLSEVKNQYNNLQRICITCKSETVVLSNEKTKMQKLFNQYLNGKKARAFEQELKLESVLNAGRLSYIKRNEKLIDLSEYCVFYFDESYTAKTQEPSGTKIAYEYALRKNKTIILIK